MAEREAVIKVRLDTSSAKASLRELESEGRKSAGRVRPGAGAGGGGRGGAGMAGGGGGVGRGFGLGVGLAAGMGAARKLTGGGIGDLGSAGLAGLAGKAYLMMPEDLRNQPAIARGKQTAIQKASRMLAASVGASGDITEGHRSLVKGMGDIESDLEIGAARLKHTFSAEAFFDDAVEAGKKMAGAFIEEARDFILEGIGLH